MQIAVLRTGLGVRGNALRAGAMLIALLAAFAPMLAAAPAQVAPAQLDPAHRAPSQALRKVSVVSFGLFGGQDVFRSEATGAAAVVASRFGGDPVVVRFNTRKSSDATIEALSTTLETAGKRIESSTGVLFLILTSHGSPDGLVVTVGRKAQR